MQKTMVQKLSASVRTRLLFGYELEIDRSLGSGHFSGDYLVKLISHKKDCDAQMHRTFGAATLSCLLLYLTAKGLAPSIPIFGVQFSNFPGLPIFLSFSASASAAFSIFLFFNAQAYSALIDSVILRDSESGTVDVDMIKAGYEMEFLVLKTFRKEFSFYRPVRIRYRRVGDFFLRLTYATMTLVFVLPFAAIIVAPLIIAFAFIPNDFFGVAAKAFSLLTALSATLVTFVSIKEFACDWEIQDSVTYPSSTPR